jgi:hypothetical protein
MQLPKSFVSVSLAALLCATPALAQEHVANAAAMQHAIATKTAADQGNRDAVLKALDRADVQQLATKMGLDVKQAKGAVATMSSDELAQLAASARAIEVDSAAGATTVVISVTTLLLIIIIILLIAN